MLRSVIVFLVHIFSVIVFRVKLVGKENVPKEGAYIMCANHQSNWDAPILVSSTKRKMHVMAKEELFKNRLAQSSGTLEKPVVLRQLRKEIARLKTI
mgnify:CR=1 FL=1